MNKSILDPIEQSAVKYSDQTAVLHADQKITYAQLNRMVNAAADFLSKEGIKAKERVAFYDHNSLEYVVCLFALFRLEAVGCCLNFRDPLEIFSQNIKDLGVTFIITNNREVLFDKKLLPKRIELDQILSNLKDISTDFDNKGIVYDNDQPATVIYTSGSSAQPKAVVHSIANYHYSALASQDHIPVTSDTRWLLSLPLYHVGAQALLWRTFSFGGTLVIADTAQSLNLALVHYQVTHLSCVATQLWRLIQAKTSLKYLKAILLGGGPVQENLKTLYKSLHLPIYISYGLTETTSQVATSKREEGTVYPLKYVELKINDDHEILLKGKTLCLGYLSDGTIVHPVDDQGWFHTKDLGKYDKEQGLSIFGRKDNMFVSGGENIQPEEIEACLHNIREVERGIIVALEHEEYGFRPAAFVEFKPGASLSALQITNELEKFLPKFKIPDQYFEWPHTQEEALKVQRPYFEKLVKQDFHILKQIP